MPRLLLPMIVIMYVAVGSTGVSAREWFAPEPPLLSLGTGVAELFDSHQELFGTSNIVLRFASIVLGHGILSVAVKTMNFMPPQAC